MNSPKVSITDNATVLRLRFKNNAEAKAFQPLIAQAPTMAAKIEELTRLIEDSRKPALTAGEHTPEQGKWHIRAGGNDEQPVYVYQTDQNATFQCGPLVAVVYGSNYKQAQANAKLIAQAPAMAAKIDELNGSLALAIKEIAKYSGKAGRLEHDLETAKARVEELEAEIDKLKTNQIPGKGVDCKHMSNYPAEKNTVPICKAAQGFCSPDCFCWRWEKKS